MQDQAHSEDFQLRSPDRPQTFGEKRVLVSFNPSSNPAIDDMKRHCAHLIDDLEDLKSKSRDPNVVRWCSEAQTLFETAAMFAVKAIANSK